MIKDSSFVICFILIKCLYHAFWILPFTQFLLSLFVYVEGMQSFKDQNPDK